MSVVSPSVNLEAVCASINKSDWHPFQQQREGHHFDLGVTSCQNAKRNDLRKICLTAGISKPLAGQMIESLDCVLLLLFFTWDFFFCKLWTEKYSPAHCYLRALIKFHLQNSIPIILANIRSLTYKMANTNGHHLFMQVTNKLDIYLVN